MDHPNINKNKKYDKWSKHMPNTVKKKYCKKNAIRLRILPLIIFLVALSIGLLIVNNYHSLWKKEQTMLMSELVASQGSIIQRYLSQALSATHTLKSLVEVEQGKVKNFNAYAKNIFDSLDGISNLQLAPNGIVQHVYPLEGHEKAIGHNILKDDKRRDDATLAITNRELTLAGPFELVQGGTAVVGRNPIFLKNSDEKENNVDK